MNFTDGFFEFPIKIVSGYNEDKADQMQAEGEERPETPWMLSRKKIPLAEVFNLSWEEYIAEDDMWDAIKKEEEKEGKGLNSLIVTYKDMGFFCPMSKKKFEASLNEFMANIESMELPQERFTSSTISQ